MKNNKKKSTRNSLLALLLCLTMCLSMLPVSVLAEGESGTAASTETVQEGAAAGTPENNAETPASEAENEAVPAPEESAPEEPAEEEIEQEPAEEYTEEPEEEYTEEPEEEQPEEPVDPNEQGSGEEAGGQEEAVGGGQLPGDAGANEGSQNQESGGSEGSGATEGSGTGEGTGTGNGQVPQNQEGGSTTPSGEGAPQEQTSPAPAYAEEIVLSDVSLSMDALEELQLYAAVYPETFDQTVSWSSSDPTVATVDADGVVRALGRGADGTGAAVITATAAARAEDGSELSAQCFITVRSDGIIAQSPEELQSEHPYSDGEIRFWEFSADETENLALTFAEETALGVGDFLVLQFGEDEQLSYNNENIGELSGKTVAISGNTVRIWLISDDDGDTGWGFQVTAAAEAEEGAELAQGQDFSDPLADMDVPRLMTTDLGTNGAANADTASPSSDGIPGGSVSTPPAAAPILTAPSDADPTASVTMSQGQYELEALDSATLTATMTSDNSAKLTILWESSDPSAVEIINTEETARDDTAGTVTATCTVRALKRTIETPAIITATAVLISGGTPVQDSSAAMDAAASCTVTVINDGVIVSDWSQLESEHPYYRPINKFWQYTDPSAQALTITFDVQSGTVFPSDTIIITDGNKNQAGITYSGNFLAGQTVTVYDNTVRIYLRSSESGTGGWGFKVSSVYPTAGTISYTVRYYANGGTKAPETQTKAQNETLTLSKDKPVRSHYTFKGWATERTSGRVAWYPGDKYKDNADLVLYAVWDRVTVFNDSNRGSSSTSPYYGPTGTTTQAQSYPKTPIDLERPESNYDKDVLHIRTVEDLIAFSENCSLDTWSNRLPVVLDNDLSLSDVDFQPIALFNGSFDGRGHSIFDLTLTDPLAPCGLFLETGRDAIIKNLSVTGSVMPGGDNNMTGGLVGLNRGCLLNCSFTGTVSGKLETGGLVGRNEITGLVTGCRCDAAVTGLTQTGGICGKNYGTLLGCESGCYVNTESVDPSLNLDDIDTSSLLNFFHSLTTESAGITTDSGGICGYSEGFIEHCVNTGPVGYSRLGYNVGGIAGRSKGYINGSRNESAVYGRRDVGGIVGQMEPYVEVSQTQNLTAGLSYRMYALHQSIDDAIHDADVLANDLSGQLSSLSGFLAPVEKAFRDLSITDPDSVLNLRKVIVDMVSGMAGQLQSMSASLGEGSDVMKEDLQAISGNLDALSGSALQTVNLLSESQNEEVIVDESAALAAEALTLGKTTDCRNNGEVNGETNVGGIVGVIALENALDPELDLTQTDALLRQRYSYRSVVSRSVNDAAVSAWYECAGGIVGKADIGYIANCAAYSSVELADGAYAGGIAGLCYGTVENCVARCSLNGSKYVGGIVGNGYTASGKDDRPSAVTNCYSLVDIQERAQYSGAISGGAEGEYQANYFVPAGFAGLNKLSVYGKAEPILFSVFNSVLSLPEESKVFTLRFTVEGVPVKEVSFEYGASFTRDVFPTVESRDGAYAVWDRTDLTDLRFDTTVNAEYRRSETALGSDLTRENGRPAAYVIGQFQEGDAVTAEILPVEEGEIRQFRPGWLQMAKEQIRSVFHEPDYSICVAVTEKLRLNFPKDGLDRHTIHYMSPDGSTGDFRLYLKTENGYERLPIDLFGSYFSFEAPGTSPEICLVSTVQSWWFLAYIAVFLILLLLVIHLLVRIVRKLRNAPRKQKRKAERTGSRLPAWIRAHRKIVTIVCAALVAVLLAAALLLQSGWLQSGFAGYRVLKQLTTQETDLQTEIKIRLGEEEMELSNTLQQVSQDGRMIICMDQYGINLYLADGTLYLENGRAFKLVSRQIDQKTMLRLAMNAVRKGHVVREKDGDTERYSTEIDSETVGQILSLYLSEDIGAVFRGDQLHAEMDVQNGTLTAIRLTGEGSTGDGTALGIEATITPQPLSDRPQVPEAVLTAIRSGGESNELMTGDMLRLFAAWFKNDRASAVDATITVSADCGILSLDDSYSYFRQKVKGTNISCVSSRLFRVYFTDEAACSSDGSVLSTAETRLWDAAQLIPLMREFFLQGSYTCEELGNGQLYTLTLEADKIPDLVEQVIPELKDLNISYQDCSLSAGIRDGNLYSLELSCGGSVRIVTRDVDASAAVMVRFVNPSDHVIPTAVQNTLLNETA